MRIVLVLLLGAVALGGCGATNEADRIADDVRQRAEDARDRFEPKVRKVISRAEEISRDVRVRVAEVLEDLRKAVPEATPATRTPTSQGRTSAGAIDGYLTEVIEDVDRYWTRTLRANRLPAPRVRYSWVAPGDRQISACDVVAGDRAAFYCPADDTIYIGQVIAAELFEGVARGFPGQEAGQGRAVGDFGVAYIVAHEYAHNIQAELGFFDAGQGTAARPFELQADCMAGLWGNSVYREGRLKPGDIEEALGTALAVGDFEFGNEQHHGTPQERRDAWLTGFQSGDPVDCRRFTEV